MKRRYKAGDWIRIRLGGQADAVAILARAGHARLFGYFFRVPAGTPSTHAQLKAMRAQDAVYRALFGGAPIENARWSLVATSLAFNPEDWPLPQCVRRSAFGGSQRRITFDERTLRVQADEPMLEAAVEGVEARFLGERELEDALRTRLGIAAARLPLMVHEVRPGFDAQELAGLSAGACVQFSRPLGAVDVRRLGLFLRERSDVTLRVHGFEQAAFDLRTLRACDAVRHLILDVRTATNMDELLGFSALARLDVRGTLDLSVLPSLRGLTSLGIRGAHLDPRPLQHCADLRELGLSGSIPRDFNRFASRQTLQRLRLAHAHADLTRLHALRCLEVLEMRNIRLASLPQLDEHALLRHVILHGVFPLRDLSPLAGAPALETLELRAMPQLQVADAKPIVQCRQLKHITVDLGSRAKSREVYFATLASGEASDRYMRSARRRCMF